MHKIECINLEWQLIEAPKPTYKTETWGPKDRPWDMTFVSNDPYTEKLRIVGDRYVDGEFTTKYIRYL